MKVVIDTNVLLSAVLRDRVPEQVLLLVASRDDWKWIVTTEILQEYAEVLRRPKFKLNPELIQNWTDLLSLRTFNLGFIPLRKPFPRDPKDAPFLAAAIYSDAEYLISGDNDLLTAKLSISCKIVTVREFAAEFLVGEAGA
ncbi:MAG TPA: putative toxin-antitoxin system toxin component, PIN family [Pirellulales bacterium]|jgi:putative PIN family toxin of toxin-antitoxin system